MALVPQSLFLFIFNFIHIIHLSVTGSFKFDSRLSDDLTLNHYNIIILRHEYFNKKYQVVIRSCLFCYQMFHVQI